MRIAVYEAENEGKMWYDLMMKWHLASLASEKITVQVKLEHEVTFHFNLKHWKFKAKQRIYFLCKFLFWDNLNVSVLNIDSTIGFKFRFNNKLMRWGQWRHSKTFWNIFGYGSIENFTSGIAEQSGMTPSSIAAWNWSLIRNVHKFQGNVINSELFY